jgi:hypothetical protein
LAAREGVTREPGEDMEAAVAIHPRNLIAILPQLTTK